jgi:hypothetical protein
VSHRQGARGEQAGASHLYRRHFRGARQDHCRISIARDPMLHLSAAAWIFAFAGFAAVFGPLLARRRAS